MQQITMTQLHRPLRIIRRFLRAILLSMVVLFVGQVWVAGGYLIREPWRPIPWLIVIAIDLAWVVMIDRRRFALICGPVVGTMLIFRAIEIAEFAPSEIVPFRFKVNAFFVWGTFGGFHMLVSVAALILAARAATLDDRRVVP